MEILTELAQAPGRYRLLLCDVWGVIHDGVRAFPAACAALSRWRAERGPVVLISNSPRPQAEVAAQLAQLGAPKSAWSAIVTSGDASRALLAARAPGPVLALGPERDAPLYAGLDLAFAPLEDARFICCTGLIDDETESPDDYRELLTAAAGRGLEMICANPDIVVQRGERLIWCAGALARLYEEMGGRVLMAGKPHAPIYELALAEAAALSGASAVDKAEVLAIGDGLATDIAGALAQGLDALFVADGIHAAQLMEDGRLSAPAVEAMLAVHGLSARFAMAPLS